MKLKTWIHRPQNSPKWKFKVKEWACCGHLWQLLVSYRYPDRGRWVPVCPDCKKKGLLNAKQQT